MQNKNSKISYHLIELLLVVILIFFIRDDLLDFYKNKILPAINKIDQSDVFNFDVNTEKVTELKEEVKTSGLLDFTDQVVSKNSIKGVLDLKKVIELTNSERSKNGDLPSLKENSKLDFSAEKKVQDIFDKQYFEHLSPDGVGVADLASEVSYDYILIGENLAMGNFKDEKDLVNAWMNSSGHRANILNKNYNEIGVAVGEGVLNGNKVWVAVQHFGLPKDACPQVDDVLKSIIEYNQEKIENYENELTLLLNDINNGVVSRGKTTRELSEEYNQNLIIYNKLVEETKNKVEEYNTEVKNFNECLLSKTNENTKEGE